METGDAIVCAFCGRALLHTPEDNAYFGTEPYPADLGYGLCRGCGGDSKAADIRERMGAALCMIVDARIPLVAKRLGDAHRERFLELPYESQALFIIRLMEEGVIT